MTVLLTSNQGPLNIPKPLDSTQFSTGLEYLDTTENRGTTNSAVELDNVLEPSRNSFGRRISRYHALHVPKYPINRLSQFIKQKLQTSPKLVHKTSVSSLGSVVSFSLSDDDSSQPDTVEDIFLDLSFKGLEKFPEIQNDVTHLVLTQNSINRFPLCAFWNLPHLVVLDLSYNLIVELPPDIGQVKTLKELYLRDNKIEILPSTLYSLENLEVLDLSENHIQKIDASICRLVSLYHLDIRNNQLIDVPFSLGLLSANLTSFLVDGNPFIYPFSDLVVPILSTPFRGKRSFIKISNLQRDKSQSISKNEGLAGYGYGDDPMYKTFSLGRLGLNRKPAVVTLLDNDGMRRKERKISPPLMHLWSNFAQQHHPIFDAKLRDETDAGLSQPLSPSSNVNLSNHPENSKVLASKGSKFNSLNPFKSRRGSDLNCNESRVSADKIFKDASVDPELCADPSKGPQFKALLNRTLRSRFSSPNLLQRAKRAPFDTNNEYTNTRRSSIDHQNASIWNLNNPSGYDLLSSSAYSTYSNSTLFSRPDSWISGDVSSVTPAAVSVFLDKLRDLYDLDPETNERDLLKVGIQKRGNPIAIDIHSSENELTYRKAVHLSMYGIVDQRNNIINEIIATEETYVASLENLITIYLSPAATNKVMSPRKIKAIFSNVESILLFHREHLLPALKLCLKEENQCIGRVFAKHNPYIKMYSVYINNFDYALSELQLLIAKHPKRTSTYLKSALQHPNHNQLNLQGYLLLPVQRIPRYKMLLQDLLANTLPNHPDIENLRLALEEITVRAQEINERKREHERKHRVIAIQAKIKGASEIPLVQPYRRYIHEGTLHLYRIVRTFTAQVKDPKTQKTRECPYLHEMIIDSEFMFYLFNDIMIKCKPSNKEFRKLRILQLSSRSKPATLIDNHTMRLVDNQTILYFTGSTESLKQWTELINHRLDF